MTRLVVRGDRGDVAIEDGVVVEVGPDLPGGDEEVDARGHLLLPGVVDAHVHLDDPGRADWEGIPTGSAALAAGGVTCAVDMPLNSIPPTVDAAGFDAKTRALRGRTHVDMALWGGLVPGDLDRLDALADRGVVGFKAFMAPSGVEEFPHVGPDALQAGMARAARLGLPVAVHAEDPAVIAPLTAAAVSAGRVSMRDWAASRPVRAEVRAVQTAIAAAAVTGCALHVVHVSSGAAVALVAEARARGVDVTCEVTPHHLVLTADDAERIGAAAKCAPPLRSQAEREALWRALAAGGVDTVGSDHSPGPPHLKTGDDMFAVWGGVAGAQTTLAVVMTEAARHGVAAGRLRDVLCAAPARRLRLAGKGGLRPGDDGDVVLVRTGVSDRLRAGNLLYRHRVSPFDGMTLTARVVRTILRGVTVALEGRVVGPPGGRLVTPAGAA